MEKVRFFSKHICHCLDCPNLEREEGRGVGLCVVVGYVLIGRQMEVFPPDWCPLPVSGRVVEDE